MRSQEEIVARIKERRPQDPLGFELGDYLEYLEFDQAKQFLKEGTTREQWDEATKEQKAKSPIETLKEYMPFAWDKANNQRGISANRSISHCIAWLWLAEEHELLGKVVAAFDEDYKHYGKPILEMVCEHFGVDWKALDNGERSNG